MRSKLIFILGCFVSFFIVPFPIAVASPIGVINVRDFGAIGDGAADDTAAIERAIASLPTFDGTNPFRVTEIYFPNGTYLVSNPITRSTPKEGWSPGLAVVGESRENTIIRLRDHAEGYSDPKLGKAVLFFASGMRAGRPTDGGKDYFTKGEGGEGYENYLMDITVSTGIENPGAIGVDFLANNIGGIRNVTITSEDDSSLLGLSLDRKWIGPAYVGKLDIRGFSTGISVSNTEYSIVLNHVSISGARTFGLKNNGNVVVFSNLTVDNFSGIAISNTGRSALLVGYSAILSGFGVAAIDNNGYMNISGVDKKKFLRAPLSALPTETTEDDGVFGPLGRIGPSSLEKPQVSQAETDLPVGLSERFVDLSGVGNGQDAAKIIQDALNSGSPKVILPGGVFTLRSPLIIPSTVRVFDGSFATLRLQFGPATSAIGIAFTSQNIGKLFIRRLNIENVGNSAKTAFLHDGPGALVLQDIYAGAIQTIHRTPKSGEIIVENLCGSTFLFEGIAPVTIFQLNTEGLGTRIINFSKALKLIGVKTEQNMTLLRNMHGARADIWGAFAYMVYLVGNKLPYIENLGGNVVASIAEESFRRTAVYDTFISGGSEGTVESSAFPTRNGFGKMVPETEQILSKN